MKNAPIVELDTTLTNALRDRLKTPLPAEGDRDYDKEFFDLAENPGTKPSGYYFVPRSSCWVFRPYVLGTQRYLLFSLSRMRRCGDLARVGDVLAKRLWKFRRDAKLHPDGPRDADLFFDRAQCDADEALFYSTHPEYGQYVDAVVAAFDQAKAAMPAPVRATRKSGLEKIIAVISKHEEDSKLERSEIAARLLDINLKLTTIQEALKIA